MRLVINSRNCNGGAGLKRYKGDGIYSSYGKKNTGLRKVMNTTERNEADADDQSKKMKDKESMLLTLQTLRNVQKLNQMKSHVQKR